ncbi:MAG: hypothetical protein ACKOD3_12430 [Phenylobacterium sp.]
MASPGKRAFLARLTPEVLSAVERLAAAEMRSVNAQVEVLLREALRRRGVNPSRPATEAEPQPPTNSSTS